MTASTSAGQNYLARWDAYRTECKERGLWTPADESLWAAAHATIPAVERDAAEPYQRLVEAAWWVRQEPTDERAWKALDKALDALPASPTEKKP